MFGTNDAGFLARSGTSEPSKVLRLEHIYYLAGKYSLRSMLAYFQTRSILLSEIVVLSYASPMSSAPALA